MLCCWRVLWAAHCVQCVKWRRSRSTPWYSNFRNDLVTYCGWYFVVTCSTGLHAFIKSSHSLSLLNQALTQASCWRQQAMLLVATKSRTILDQAAGPQESICIFSPEGTGVKSSESQRMSSCQSCFWIGIHPWFLKIYTLEFLCDNKWSENILGWTGYKRSSRLYYENLFENFK